MKKGLAAFCTTALVLAAGTIGYAETIKIHGSSTTHGKIMVKIMEPFKKATGIDLELLPNGSVSGAKDLVAGKCDASMASESLAEITKAVPALNNAQEHILAQDTIRVIVNKQNPVTTLTKEQLKGLHSGKLKNWKEAGGADSDVIVVTSHKGSGTRQVFEKQIMDGAPYVSDAIEVATTMAEVKEVSGMKEAIGAVSESFVNDTVKAVETPNIGRPLILITKGNPSPSVKKLIDYIKSEGQKHIR